MTVTGPMEEAPIGPMLPHEHVLVDFIGAEKVGPHRYDPELAFTAILPHLERARTQGFMLMAECTPAYLGRDPQLLRRLSEATGLRIVTNTGYYGARDGVFLPAHAYRETAEQLADRWIEEWRTGIDGTGIRPGFIKIAVNGVRPLSGMDRKLVRAAALAHQQTGLPIVSHTKDGPVFEELEILRGEGVDASSFNWAHAQDEHDKQRHVAAAELGAWIAFDGVNENLDPYLEMIEHMKLHNLLHRVLLSHDAGWYEPGNPGRKYKGYDVLSTRLVPALREHSFTQDEIDTLVVRNPAEAFAIRVRGLKTENEATR